MPQCYACNQPVSNTRQSNGQYRKFCTRKCYVAWSLKNKGVKQLVAVRHKDHAKVAEAVKKAREGDTAARAFLRREHGVRGLWNPNTQKVERW